MESVVRILLMWMLVTVVAAGPTEPPSGTVLPPPKDITSPVPTQPIPSATPQGRPIPNTTPSLLKGAKTKTVNTKVEKKPVPAAVGTSLALNVSTTEKIATEKVLSPVKSVNGHPASNGEEVLPSVQNDKKYIPERMKSSDKLIQRVRQTDSNGRSPAPNIQKERVTVVDAKTDSVASPSMDRASNVIIAPASFVQQPPDTARVQNSEKTVSGVPARKHQTISNAERERADFRNLLKNNTSVIIKQNQKGGETIRPKNTFDPIRLVGKKVIPNHSDRSSTIQSRIDHDIRHFPVEFPSFTKSIESAFQPSPQFDLKFPRQNSFVPSRPPALAAPFIQLTKDGTHKTMTSKNTEAKEILPKHFNRTIGNEKPPATNSTSVTPPSRKITESSKLSSNTNDSRTPTRIRQSPTQASYSSRIKTSEGIKELRKIEQSRNQTRVEMNRDQPGSRNATKTGNPTSSDNLPQLTNTTSKLTSTIQSPQLKLPSRTSEISWSNIITQKSAYTNDKISIVKEIVAQEGNEKQSKVSTKTVPTKAIIVKKNVPSATLKNNVINHEQKTVVSPIQPSGRSDKLNNTIEIDLLNFKLPTAIRNHRKEISENVEGDSIVADSQVSITELSLEMARPFRTHRIRGGSPKVQQVLTDLDVNNHQVITVTNDELDELVRSAPPSVKIRNFETLGSAEKKLVMQNLHEVENSNFREVPRQPGLFEDDVSSSLIRQLTTQRRPSGNSHPKRESSPAKHTDDFQDSGVFAVKTSDYIKISGENEFLKFAQSDNFFGNLKDHPKEPVRPLRLQADQTFSNPDMRVTKLTPVQVMRNVGNDDNFDGLGAMLDEKKKSREDDFIHGEIASVRGNSVKDKRKEVGHHDRHPSVLTIRNTESQEQRHPVTKQQVIRITQPQDQHHEVPTTQVLWDTQPQDQRLPVPKSQLSEKTQLKGQRHTVPTSQLLSNTQPHDQRHTVPTSQLLRNTQPHDQRHTVPTSQLVQTLQQQDQHNTVPTLQLVQNTQTEQLHHSGSESKLLQQQQQQQELQKLQLEKQEQQLRTQLQQELREQGKLLQKIEIQEENQRRAHQLQQLLDKQKEEQLQKQRQHQIQLQLNQQEKQRFQLQLERQKEEQLQKQRQIQVQLEPQKEQILQQQIEKQKEERPQKQNQQPKQFQQQEQQKQQQQLGTKKDEQQQKHVQLQRQEQHKLLQQQQQSQEAIVREKREEIEKQKQLQQNVNFQLEEQSKTQLAMEGKQATSTNWLQFQRQPDLPVTNLEGRTPPTLEQLFPLYVKRKPSSIQLPTFPRNLPMPEPVLLTFLDQIPDNIDDLQEIDGNGVELQMSGSVPGLAEALMRNNREAVYPEHDPRFFPAAGYNIMPYFLGFPSFGYFDMDVHKE